MSELYAKNRLTKEQLESSGWKLLEMKNDGELYGCENMRMLIDFTGGNRGSTREAYIEPE